MNPERTSTPEGNNEHNEKVKKELTEALKVLEFEHPRIDSAIYHLLETKKVQAAEIASTLFRVTLLRVLETMRAESNLLTLLHGPKHAAVAFMRYALKQERDEDNSFYSADFESFLGKVSTSFGRDLILFLAAEQEDVGNFSLETFGSAYYYKMLGEDKKMVEANKQENSKEQKTISSKLEDNPKLKEVVYAIREKYLSAQIPTKEEVDAIIVQSINQIKKMIENL